MTKLSHIGLVVHPTRDISEPLAEVQTWADAAGVRVVQVAAGCRQRDVATRGSIDDTELVVAIGGDGTTLAAMRSAVAADRPVLGVACGSLGALTTTPADQVAGALARFREDRWKAVWLPVLQLRFDDGDGPFAINDIALVRNGEGQLRTSAKVGDVPYARFAGDGCIVSTPVGSSAYALAAGGPLLTPGAHAFLLTPVSVHGGFCPPLVLSGDAELELEVTTGYGGARLEVDGQVHGPREGIVRITLRTNVAQVVRFDGQEPFLTGLRRRQIIIDSPRILAEDARA